MITSIKECLRFSMILNEGWIVFLICIVPFLSIGAQGEDCVIPDDYTTLPPNDTYALPGDSFMIVAQHVSLAPSNLLNLSSNVRACEDEDSSVCMLDVNQGILNIKNFEPRFAGSYQFLFSFGFEEDDACMVNFNIHEAIPPTINAENNELTLDTDQGLMLNPTITHGTPPGTVHWFKDNQLLSIGDTYSVAKVQAEDRGFYNATIIQPTVNNNSVSTTYKVLVNFSPKLELTESVVNDQVQIRCISTSHPQVTDIQLRQSDNDDDFTAVNNVNTNKRQQIEDDLSFIAVATHTVTDSCSFRRYRCIAENTISSVSVDISACQSAANVVELAGSPHTNVSIRITWDIEPDGTSVDSYEIHWEEVKNTTSSKTLTYDGSSSHYDIQGLLPGVQYNIRMRAMNNNGFGANSTVIQARPFTVPLDRPRSIDIYYDSRENRQDAFLQWGEVTPEAHAPVTGYDIIYRSDNDPNPVVVPVEEGTVFNLSTLSVTSGITYHIKVRATNEWGVGQESAEVEYRVMPTDPTVRVNVSLNEIDVTNTMVTLHWTINNDDAVNHIIIEVDRLLIASTQRDPVFYPVYQYNTTNEDTVNSNCFSDLNSSDIYRFCVIAVSNDGQRISSCMVISTGQNTNDRSTSGCVSVLDLTGNDDSVIPSWVIIVCVVVCVVLVVVVFGGCGLYFGLKRTKRGDGRFESPNQSFDKIPQPGNGYPYPPPPPRSTSPAGRSCVECKSYRHNNHAHQMDWQASNPVNNTTIV